MIRKQLFSLIFYFLHTTIKVISKLINIISYFTSTSPFQYFKIPSLLHNFNHKQAYNLTKIPRHLGLVLTEKKLVMERVCEMVVCCLLWGIPSISLYHPTEFLKSKQAEIKKLVTEKIKEYINSNNNKINNKEESLLGKLVMGDGAAFNLDDHLFILGDDDGKDSLVKLARNQASKKNLNDNITNLYHKNNSRNSLEEVYKTREIMQEMQGFGDVELVLKIGEVCVGLCGYIPWNTRLTEILSIPSHTRITTSSLLDTLHSFSRITQRAGV